MTENKNEADYHLSEDFKASEFRCHCCGVLKFNPDLIMALQDLRDLAGVPIKINDGYRCPKHNIEVGGVIGSQHTIGNAADIVIHGKTVFEMFNLAERIAKFNEGGIGQYPRKHFLHVDVRSGGPARWTE